MAEIRWTEEAHRWLRDRLDRSLSVKAFDISVSRVNRPQPLGAGREGRVVERFLRSPGNQNWSPRPRARDFFLRE